MMGRGRGNSRSPEMQSKFRQLWEDGQQQVSGGRLQAAQVVV